MTEPFDVSLRVRRHHKAGGVSNREAAADTPFHSGTDQPRHVAADTSAQIHGNVGKAFDHRKIGTFESALARLNAKREARRERRQTDALQSGSAVR